jgi:hypothetical protein
MITKSKGAEKVRKKHPSNGQRRIVKTYRYVDETGELLYEVVRYEPKDFRQRRPDGKGGYIYELEGVRRVLYRLPELRTADESRPVFIPEGEKDVDNLYDNGLIATTNAMGAGKWRPEYTEALRGRNVVLLPDNDEPGQKHAETIARELCAAGASVKILKLPSLAPKGDVSDWIAAGGTKEQLLKLAMQAPDFEPDPPAGVRDGAEEAPLVPSWPDQISKEALHGLPGANAIPQASPWRTCKGLSIPPPRI